MLVTNELSQIGLSDKELVEQARSGEHAAIGHLLQRYKTRVLSQIRAQVTDFYEINDLFQEVCIKVWRFITSFKRESNFTTWLYRITQNTVINYYRSKIRQKKLEEQLAHHFYSEQENDPELILIGIRLNEKVNVILYALPRHFRQCFYLYAIAGLAYSEIAQRLKCPLGTVRSRIHRVRTLIAAQISQE